jgi:hypothetical protein
MIAIYTYQVYNTGSTIYSFTFTDLSGNLKFFDILPYSSQYFYIKSSSVTSPSPDIIVNLIDSGFSWFHFSSTTSSDTFDFPCSGGTVFSALTIGDIIYTEKVISTENEPEIIFNGCFKLIGSGSTQIYDIFSVLGWNGNPCPPCYTSYCISNTGFSSYNDNYDDTFLNYNGQHYYTGETTGNFIYYISGNTSQWCLSTSLGGTCLLSGKSPCNTSCPDLFNEYFTEGMCVTPTPTPTNYCGNLDFTALFNCEFEPTPSVTPTMTQTPTPTQTPTSTNVCGGFMVDSSISSFSPTPTPTPTNTPTSSTPIYRGCNYTGPATFTIIDDNIICVGSSMYQDCRNGFMYYTTQQLSNPSTGPILKYMVFSAYVNETLTCITYFGTDYAHTSGGDNIVLVAGDFGYVADGACFDCDVVNLPTPTPTPTHTMTPTPTQTPTPTHNVCNPSGLQPSTFLYPSVLKNNGINSNLSYSINLYYKLSGTPNSCYNMLPFPLVAGYPEYTIAPGSLTNTFVTGVTYDIYVTNSQSPLIPVKFGIVSGDFTTYCGTSNPAQVAIPSTSGVTPFYVNVNVWFNSSLNQYSFENC